MAARIAASIIVIIFLLEPVACVDEGDEFSNNLFSDLAPLLQLFGEQVAKQFMSQSMGWADNVIFAMAPLGIITAIIGAIRVGGPTWLKAVIGRARENRAAAEVELMSSTSHEVSEVWNGQALVRTTGLPPMRDIIYFPRRRAKDDFGLQTLEEAKSKGYLKADESNPKPKSRTWTKSIKQLITQGRSSGTNGLAGKTVDENPEAAIPPAAQTQASRIPASAPNVFINLQPRRSRLELYTTAIFGTVLQLGVLMFAGLTTYYPPWKLQKDGREIANYAYPLTALGTLILVIGMLICSFVIDQSTQEKDWEADSEDCKGAHIMWLQRREVVNDQLFESFAIFAKGKRNSILTSRRAETSTTSPDPGNSDVQKTSSDLSSLVVVGTLIGACGFITQFTGLRGMNWSTTIMQLAATLTMTCLRAWVRRDLAQRPATLRMPTEFEIDWLATRLARCQPDSWPDDEKELEDFRSGDWEWNIVKGADASGKFHDNDDDDDDDGGDGYGEKTVAQRVMKVRERLGRLCRWTGPASEPAVSVATAIEEAMNILFPNEHNRTFVWQLKAKVGARPTEEEDIHFTVRQEEGRWVANASEIEAALSLWLFALHEEERQHVKEGPQGDKDWLRHGNMSVRKQCLQLICQSTLQLGERLILWIPHGFTKLLSVKKAEGGQAGTNPDDTETIEFDNTRVIESPGCVVEQRPPRGITTYQSQSLGELGPAELEAKDQFLAVVSDAPLAIVLAQSLFSYSISAIVDVLDPASLEGIGAVTKSLPVGSSVRMENKVLLKIAQAAERAGLGNLQEAYICIIPAFLRKT